MIRKMIPADLKAVLQIWLTANLEAHAFIPAVYWRQNQAVVQKALMQADVYVYHECGVILGFIGLEDQFIAGLFVAKDARGQGIGSQLLAVVKAKHWRLTLTVYQQNHQACHFYQQAGFQVVKVQQDSATQATEFLMRWQAPAAN